MSISLELLGNTLGTDDLSSIEELEILFDQVYTLVTSRLMK